MGGPAKKIVQVTIADTMPADTYNFVRNQKPGIYRPYEFILVAYAAECDEPLRNMAECSHLLGGVILIWEGELEGNQKPGLSGPGPG